MRLLLILACLLAIASVESAYSKYGRTCEDIGCLSNEECVMEEDLCTLQSKGHCGKFPACKRVKPKATTCDNYVCPLTQVCQVKNKQPRCVNSENSLPHRRKRQSYNPSSPIGDTSSSSNTQPKYPDLHEQSPNEPTRSRKVTTERPNTYQIGYTQSQNSYPTQAGYPAQRQPSQGYPTQRQPSQGYPNQGYSNQGYPNQGYPNQGYPNQGYPNQGYPNQGNQPQGYPNQGYPSQGYPNQGYPGQGYYNQGYPNQGYPNQGYPNQGYAGYQNPGYQNPGYQNQGYGGQQPPQGHKQPSFLDPILNTLSKTVTQLGANYLRDKIFNTNTNKQNSNAGTFSPF